MKAHLKCVKVELGNFLPGCHIHHIVVPSC